MRRRLQQARDAWTFVRGVSRGVRKGDLFPAAGRRSPAAAPGGTVETETAGGVWRRLREEVGWFVQSEHRIELPGLTAPLRVLHLTDVHLRAEGPWLDALCARLEALPSPDLVLLTGDIVTRGWTEAAVLRFLGALPAARLGRFAILGNWEWWAGAPPIRWRPLLEGAGVRLLVNEVVDLGALILGGTDDHLAGKVDLHAFRAILPLGRPTVVMTHSPAAFAALAGPPVHLVLAGHSHAGQLRLPMLGAMWVPKGTDQWIAGWYEAEGSHLYVGRGLGWSIAPVRLRCPPELALIHLLPG